MSLPRTLTVLALALLATLLSSPLSAQVLRGTDFIVGNTTAGPQSLSKVAVAANGDFVVVWQSGIWDRGETSHIWARLFKADGTPKGPEFRVTDARPQEAYPAVAMEPDGDFIVVWQSGSFRDSSVFGRRFTARGRPLGARFRLSQATEESQTEPAVAFQPDGSFVVAWAQSRNPRRDGDEVYARRFAADGTPASPDLLVTPDDTTDSLFWDAQHRPQVASFADGGFVVGWLAYGGESTFYDVLARLYDASGAPLGEEFVANSGVVRVSQFEFALTVIDSGELVIVWTDAAADPEVGTDSSNAYGILGQRFAADGSRLGELFHVNSIARLMQHEPSISAIPGGGFFVAWVSELPEAQRGSVLYGRRFSRNAVPSSPEVQLSNPALTGTQSAPSVAVAPNGRGIVTWTRSHRGFVVDSRPDVYAQRLIVRR
jgi:large repetitive protein